MQCGSNDAIAVDALGKRMPKVPFFISAAATEEDWRRSVVSNGGKGHHLPGKYYYFVTAD